ncbi:hypothetical protein GECvBN3_gp030c [Salmonella phage GEC_vB_N3]|uniref:Uncharacterized protein n=2 Tax=Epseptimavirus TaxID=2732017 RepID=A0A7S9XEN6_9CAUD|nr:hypothetical protein GECvBN3_gp030c [Salmonella phage GEC_vB_N3]QPI15472.1 hypothetical protein GECvBN7_gp029c [Salmonella phage GEC_vB_N7]
MLSQLEEYTSASGVRMYSAAVITGLAYRS